MRVPDTGAVPVTEVAEFGRVALDFINKGANTKLYAAAASAWRRVALCRPRPR